MPQAARRGRRAGRRPLCAWGERSRCRLATAHIHLLLPRSLAGGRVRLRFMALGQNRRPCCDDLPCSALGGGAGAGQRSQWHTPCRLGSARVRRPAAVLPSRSARLRIAFSRCQHQSSDSAVDTLVLSCRVVTLVRSAARSRFQRRATADRPVLTRSIKVRQDTPISVCASRHNSCITQGTMLSSDKLTRKRWASQSTADEQPHIRQAKRSAVGTDGAVLDRVGPCRAQQRPPHLLSAEHAMPHPPRYRLRRLQCMNSSAQPHPSLDVPSQQQRASVLRYEKSASMMAALARQK
jgi:hypothetical protein